jgi:hypothetical protein
MEFQDRMAIHFSYQLKQVPVIIYRLMKTIQVRVTQLYQSYILKNVCSLDASPKIA